MSKNNFISDTLALYCENNSASQPDYLNLLIEETKQKSPAWNMLSGKYQGRFLSILSKLRQPKNILEIGTYTGFSALCLAEGLQEKGQLTTLDVSDQYRNIFEKYFEMSAFEQQINFVKTRAENYISTIDWPIDLVFIDAAKKQYSLYLDLLKPKLNTGAPIIADNILWKGMVLDKKTEDDRAIALDAFNKKMTQDEDFQNVLLPIRDGLMVGLKL